jgi:dephospho-CoA kinase
MVRIGVTGGAGAGKTTVLRKFEAFGASALDADDIVRELYAPGTPAHQALCWRWGSDIVAADGSIDRGKVANLVFASPAELAWLNKLIHPLVKQRFLQKSKRGSGLMFCAVPLLFESGWEKDMTRTITVWCDGPTQWERLRRRGWSDAHIKARLHYQMPADEKLRRADFGIINNSSQSTLDEQCRRMIERLRTL